MEEKQRKFPLVVAVVIVSLILVALVVGYNVGANYVVPLEQSLEVEAGSIHLNVYVTRAGSNETETIKDGVLIHNAGTVTTIGLNWIEDQMGDSPSVDPAKWVSVSNDGGGPAAGWTELPAEIAANGLTRAAGTYASTGNGVWTITKVFTATGGQSAQLAGLNWAAAGDGNLLCADTFAAVALINGDTLTVQWTITVT